MKANLCKRLVTLLTVIGSMTMSAHAQDEYVSPTKPAETGKSPGVKTERLSKGLTETYILIFSRGDEVVSGLTEFAQKYGVKSAHYTAIGDASSAKVGWYDSTRKMFKVIPIPEPSEITSLVGDIAMFNGKPVAHTHVNVATSDGLSHGGHLLQMFVGPTLEVIVTVEPTPLYKRLDPESGQVSLIRRCKNKQESILD